MKKVAVITGASKGIGRAIAKALSEEGFSLSLGARSVNLLKELVEELNTEVFYSYLDVSDPVSVKEFATNTLKKFRNVDVVIANAGIGIPGRLDEISEDDFMRTIQVNLLGVWRTIKAFLPSLKERRGVAIVVTSDLSTRLLPGSGAYVVSKWGARALVRTFQLENPEVRFLELRPGAVDTHFYGKPGRKREEGFMKPEDVAEIVRMVVKLPTHVRVEEVMFRSIYQDPVY
ncbi:alcohol dehydrogenase [Thermococcus chitonophagus]|uniref:Alcohol dehydrogenase n=1 Tax=Thermococcus chitonophagus TaxID=54262 RepID=A0A170SRM7_9EURY|nr:SDR family oxidoreductase [Thermococcus chitonophagus]ASJ16493.1 alcohol dehydrogenase [Thermococcus chitonophagus]CUX78508.1 FIG062860: Dehydrogenases with different specificities (related to short-chain alcohol dehydrogenases) [Thermococcus chitonophagus]